MGTVAWLLGAAFVVGVVWYYWDPIVGFIGDIAEDL